MEAARFYETSVNCYHSSWHLFPEISRSSISLVYSSKTADSIAGSITTGYHRQITEFIYVYGLTLWSWSWTFKFQHTIYVKCEYFMNLKESNIVKYTTFCRGINGDCTSKSKRNHSIYCWLNTGLSKKMDGIWNRYNLKSTGRIYTFGVLKCSEKFKVWDLP